MLEGRLLRLGLEALRLGSNVVLDFGCWSRAERSAIRWLVESVGAVCRLVYVQVDHDTQRARTAHRQSTTPDQTFPISEADLVHWRTLFEEPDGVELGEHEIGCPPSGSGWSGWLEWAAGRWPSLA
ncbi:AAA family ATPase [Streptomyces sp. NPDC051172]|uniref:AAA family ATPase n=1 Tax=Streptomyces sp. NPDC051172 TaxID=3155796 RepID=UPI00341651BA